MRVEWKEQVRVSRCSDEMVVPAPVYIGLPYTLVAVP